MRPVGRRDNSDAPGVGATGPNARPCHPVVLHAFSAWLALAPLRGAGGSAGVAPTLHYWLKGIDATL